MTDSEILEKIREIIYHKNLNFFMYTGGGGGDKIISLIYKYSNSYKNNIIKPIIKQDDNINKTLIDRNYLWTLSTDRIDENHNVKFSPEMHMLHNLKLLEQDDFYLIAKTLNEMLSFVSNPQIIKLHTKNPDSYEYFKNRTVFQYLNSKTWLDYTSILGLIKNLVIKPDVSTNDNLFNTTGIAQLGPRSKSNLIEVHKFRKFLLDNIEDINMDRIYQEIFHRLSDRHSSDYLENAIRYSKGEIKVSNFFSYIFDYSYSNYKNFIIKNRFTSFEFYNFSDGLTSKVLNDIYEIDDDNFNLELSEWHEKNLELMSKHGFDHTPYILK